MAEGKKDSNDSKSEISDLVQPMDFQIEDRPLSELEKAVKAGYHIIKDVYGKVKVVGRTVVKGNIVQDDSDVSK